MNELVTINKLHLAKLAVQEVVELDEIKQIIDQVEAFNNYAKAQKLSDEIQNDIAEYALYTTRQMGIISTNIETAAGRPKKIIPHDGIIYEPSKPQPKKDVLASAGISVQRANEAEKLAAVSDERFAEIINEKRKKGNLNKTAVVADIIREVKRESIIESLENIEAMEAKKIQGVYDVIVIDPPWDIKKIERDDRPNHVGLDYPTMSIEELKKLCIPAADNCHVWLWTINKYLPYSFDLLMTWGLKYVCAFVWHKPNGYQPYDLPKYNCEFVLYARKGTPIFTDLKAFNLCFNGDQGKHSEKPIEFYEMINRVTNGRRLDMFSRRIINGFEGWGKEAI